MEFLQLLEMSFLYKQLVVSESGASGKHVSSWIGRQQWYRWADQKLKPFVIGCSCLSHGDGDGDGYVGDTSFEDFQRFIDFRDWRFRDFAFYKVIL